MQQIIGINGEAWLIFRRALYCGIGSVIALAFYAFWYSMYLYHYPILIYMGEIIIRSVMSVCICVSTIFAIKKPRLIPLSILVSILIGFVAFIAGLWIQSALRPNEYEIVSGEFGKWLFNHFGFSFVTHVRSIFGNFLEFLLIVIFCSFLSMNVRRIIGGICGGLVITVIFHLLPFFAEEGWPVESMVELLLIEVLPYFLFGAILGFSMAFGEYLGARSSKKPGIGIPIQGA